MPKSYRNQSKTSTRPRKLFEKERINQEVQICGEYGLKNKRELWRAQLTLARLRKRARELLTLDEQDERRQFEGAALLRRMFRYGLLNSETENGLDYVLSLNIKKLLERRLQTLVYRKKLARSFHHARVMVKGKHISVDNQLVHVPSYLVTVDNEQAINLYGKSPIAGGKPGRRARKRAQ